MNNTQDSVDLQDRLDGVADFVDRMETTRSEFELQGRQPSVERARVDEQMGVYHDAFRTSESLNADVADLSKSLRKSRAKATDPSGRYNIKALEDQAAKLGPAMIEELLAIIIQGKYGGLLDGLSELGPDFQQSLLCIENDNLKAKAIQSDADHEQAEAKLVGELREVKEQLGAAKRQLDAQIVAHQTAMDTANVSSRQAERQLRDQLKGELSDRDRARQADLDKMEAEAKKARSTLEKAESRLETAKHQLTEQATAHAAALEEAKVERSKLQRRLTRAETDFEAQKLELSKAKVAHETAAQQLKLANSSVDGLSGQLGERVRELNQTKKEKRDEAAELNRSKTELQSQVLRLQEAESDLHTEVERLSGSNARLQTEVEALGQSDRQSKQALTSSESEVKGLETRMLDLEIAENAIKATLRQELAELEDQLSSKNEEVQSLEQDSLRLQDEARELQVVIDNLEVDVQRYQREDEYWEKGLLDVGAARAEARKEVVDAEAKTARLNAKNLVLENRVADADTRLERQQSEIERLTPFEVEAGNLQRLLTQAQEQADTTNEQVRLLTDRANLVQELEHDRDDARSNASRFNELFAAETKTLEGVRRELAATTLEADNLRPQAERVPALEKDLEASVTALIIEQGKASGLEKDRDAKVVELAKAQERLSMLAKDLEAKATEVEETDAKVSRLEKVLEARTNEHAAVQRQLDTKSGEHTSTSGELAALKERLEDKSREYSELETKLSTEKSNCASLQDTCASLEEQLENRHGEYATLEKELTARDKTHGEAMNSKQADIKELEVQVLKLEPLRNNLATALLHANRVSDLEQQVSDERARTAAQKVETDGQKDIANKQQAIADRVPDLDAEVSRLKGELQSSASKVASLEEDKTGLQCQVTELSEKLGAEQRDVARLSPLAARIPELEDHLKIEALKVEAESKKLVDVTKDRDAASEKLRAEATKLKRVSDRSRQVDEVANFLLNQHGRVSVGITAWLPLARASSAMVAGVPIEGEAAWTMLHWWPGSDGRPQPTLECVTVMDLVIVGFDRLLSGQVDELLCHVIRSLTKLLELATEAAVAPVVEFVRLFVKTFVGFGASRETRDILRHLCAYGVWQMLKIVAGRWPGADSVADVLGRLEALFEKEAVVPSVKTLHQLTSDGGIRLKQWVRGEDVDMAEVLPRTDFLYLREQDVVVVDLPTADGFLWLLDLAANTIRMVTANHGKWVTHRALRVGPSDDECWVLATNSKRLHWVMRHFRL